MDMRVARIEDFRPLAEKIVDGAADHFLIARYGRGRKNDRIARLNAHKPVILVGDAREGRGRLTLAARADNHHLFRLELVDIFSPDNHALGNAQVAKLDSHLYVIDHATAYQRYMALIASRVIHDLLYPRKQRGERGDNDAAWRVGKDFVERFVEHTLGRRIAGRLNARTVTHHHQYAFVAQARQCAKVGRVTIDRRVIEFVIAGMEDGAGGCMNGE